MREIGAAVDERERLREKEDKVWEGVEGFPHKTRTAATDGAAE